MNFKVNISVCRVCMKSETGMSILKDSTIQEKFVYTTRLIVCCYSIEQLDIYFKFIKVKVNSLIITVLYYNNY